MRLSRVRLAVAAGVVAAGVAALTASAAVANAGDVPVVHAPGASGYLYYVSGGYIVRVPAGGGSPHRMARVGGASVDGITTAGGRLFWIAIDDHGNGAIDYVGLTGSSRTRTLVNGLVFPVGLVSANGYLYWAGQDALGRVHPDGTSLTRRFVVVPQEAGGGVADGLATDGQHLYFSRCQDDEIGQVRVSGRGLDMRFVGLPAHACPQGLTVGNDHLYWTELAGFVGRATLHGGGASEEWLAIRTSQGPFNVAADNANLYWDWGGVAGSPIRIGTARVDRGGFRASYLLGQGALYLTTPGANS